jgi:hypothetical protein
MGMTLLPFQNLGSNIVRSTTNGSLALAVELQFGCKTEIPDLDFHLVVKEEISKLEISVDDSMAVKVFDSCANLVDVALYFKLVKAFASSEQFIQ